MNTDQRYTRVSNWVAPEQTSASFVIWPIGAGSDPHPDLAERASISIDCGAASVSIRPTVAELRILIETLQWAIEAQEVAA